MLDTQHGEEDWIMKREMLTSCNLPVGLSNAILCSLFSHLDVVKSGSFS